MLYAAAFFQSQTPLPLQLSLLHPALLCLAGWCIGWLVGGGEGPLGKSEKLTAGGGGGSGSGGR
jgi:hypothetical protein